MSDASVADVRTQRFAEVVRNFAGVPPKRFATLLPHRDGIAELRQKGASFGMIRELLAMAGIEVVADTVRRFYREVIEEPRTGAKRSPKRERAAAAAAADFADRSGDAVACDRRTGSTCQPLNRHGAAARASLIRATSNPTHTS